MPVSWDKPTIEHIFFGTWVVLIIVSLLFYLAASPALKRKVQPFASVATAVLFLFFIYLLSGTGTLLFMSVPVAFIAWYNATQVKYCPDCGALNRSVFMFPAPEYCNKCGSPLDADVTERQKQHDLRRP